MKYLNLDDRSGIDSYEFTEDSISITFTTGVSYVYDHTSAGVLLVTEMKRLATAGQGLNAFVNISKPPFARKIKAIPLVNAD